MVDLASRKQMPWFVWTIFTFSIHSSSRKSFELNVFLMHCKKSWRKTPSAWPDVSLVRGTENFFDMKIELIRRVPTIKTEYFDINGIFLQLIWRVLIMLTDYFEINGIFLRFSILTRRSFPTIFRQLSDVLIKINSSTSRARTYDLQGYNLLLCHCATLTCIVLDRCSLLHSFVSTMFSTQFTFVNAAFFFVSTVLNLVRTVLNFVQNCVFLRQYCVKLGQ